MTWHADQALIARYASGDIDQARASSIEAHLVACANCRALVAGAMDGSRLEAAWSTIRAEMHAPKVRMIERVLRWVGTPDHYARMLAATPSLSASWLLAVMIALAFAVLASHGGEGDPLPFLVIAPLLPLVGVAAAYSPGLDPTYEIGVASPMRGGRILFVRATAVFAVTAVLGGAASLALPDLDWTVAAWLLPALGMALASLMLSTWMSPVVAGGAVGTVWIGGIIATIARVGSADIGDFAWFKPAAQIGFCIIAAVAAGIAIVRSDQIDAAKRQ